MRYLTTLFYQQIDNDLCISRNVSSNNMIHVILALVFLTKLFLSSRFSALKYYLFIGFHITCFFLKC